MRAFLLMAAVLAPWADFGGMLYGLSVILEQKPAGRKTLLWLMAVHGVSVAGLFFGPYALRQVGLEYRCWPRLVLIGVFFLSGSGILLTILVLFFRQRQTRWLERVGVLLSGVMLFGMVLYCSVLYTVLTIQTEEISTWNGEKVVMIAVAGSGGAYRCHEYFGPLFMGKYLGTVGYEIGGTCWR